MQDLWALAQKTPKVFGTGAFFWFVLYSYGTPIPATAQIKIALLVKGRSSNIMYQKLEILSKISFLFILTVISYMCLAVVSALSHKI